ncbi:hypothetical protein, partial [Neisseria meningitidis]
LRNAKCFILESVPTTNTLVLHLKSESKGIFYSDGFCGFLKLFQTAFFLPNQETAAIFPAVYRPVAFRYRVRLPGSMSNNAV